MNLLQLNSKIEQSIGVYNQACDSKTSLEKQLKNQEHHLKALELAQPFFQEVAKNTQEQLKFHLTDIGQLALDTCYPEKYTFDIHFEIKRGKTEASILLRQGDNEIDPMTESGGGIVDLLSFALRIAVLSLSSFSRVIILDEPFKWLSQDLQPKAMNIMQRLSEEMGLQFIMVTHSDAIIDGANRIITIKNNKGISQMEVFDND
jgi:DNA repair exonuclease SbcCD ATPase subunit